MATSPYNEKTNWENERKYLGNLATSGTAGERTWANNQVNELNAAYAKYGGANASVQSASANPANSDYSSYINSLYSAQQNAAVNALDSAYRQSVSSLDATAQKIPAAYDAARNQTAAQSELAGQRWNEYAAASGLNSGASGQAALARSGALQGNLSSIDQAQSNAVADLELQRTQLATQYRSQVAQAIAENNISKAQALYNEAIRANSDLLNRQQIAADEAYRQKTFDYSAEQDTYAKQLEEAALRYKLTGDMSGYVNLGITSPSATVNPTPYSPPAPTPDPVPTAYIPRTATAAELSAEVMNVLRNGGAGYDTILDKIDEAWRNGAITESAASHMLTSLGR